MATSHGGSSQDIHSLNEISFSFIVLGYCYFSVMKRKQFISKFCGYCMEIPNIRFLNPGFYTYFGQATIRKWIEGGMILKGGDEYTSEVGSYISQLRASKTTVSFGSKAWSEDLEIVYSYTSLTHAIKAYLVPLLRFSSVMATFEIFPQQKPGTEKYAHIQFRS